MLGPVFEADLRRNSRRPRLIVLRTFLVILLLLFLWLAYESSLGEGSSYSGTRNYTFRGGSTLVPTALERRTAQLAEFGSKFAGFYVLIQFVFLVLVGPAYVASAIAEEKQRGTLEYLLATDLNSFEIVVGKYASRLLLLLHFVLISLPILAITLFIGGVSVELILGLLLGTVACAMSLTAVALWISVMSRKSRDALIRTYMILIAVISAWFLLDPRMFQSFPGWRGGERGFILLSDIHEFLRRFNPIDRAAALREALLSGSTDQGLTLKYFGNCFAGHLALASIFLLLTGVLLRNRYSRQTDRQARRGQWVRAYLKPAIGRHDPLFWKERHVDDGSWRLFGWFFHLFQGYSKATARLALAAWIVIPSVAITVFLAEQAFSGKPVGNWITWVTIAIYGFSLLAASIRTASSIAVEKDRQTWEALVASPLPTNRLLTSRFYGGFLSARWLFLLSALGLLILLFDSPKIYSTILVLLIASVAYLWFSVALAGCVSLNSASSVRNVLTALAMLFMINAFPWIVYLTFGTSSRPLESLFYVLSNPATSVVVVAAGLIAVLCVIGYYKMPRARWLISIVKWIGYFLLLNMALFSLLAGLTVTFGGFVGTRELSLLISPLGVYAWTVFEFLPQLRQSSFARNPDSIVLGSAVAYLLLGTLLAFFGLYRLRRSCGRMEHSRKKHRVVPLH